MQAPAAHEFDGRKCHRFDLVTAAVDRACAGRECDSVSIVMRQAKVRDRTAGQITSQILHDVARLRGRCRRRLDVRHPVDRFERLQPCRKRFPVSQVGPFRVQVQCLAAVQLLQTAEEPLAKLGAKNACVDQPVVVMFATGWRCGRRPLARCFQRRTAAGNDGVNVNVSIKLLIPCVQHHRGGRFVMLFGFQNRLQRTPRRAKQQVEYLPAIAQRQRRKFRRNREHDLVIVDPRKDPCGGRVHPVGSRRAAALRAVPVTTRMVDAFDFAALAATEQPGTQSGPCGTR